MKGTILAVDVSNQIYRALHSHLGLTSGTTFTGGLYGFLVGLAFAIRDTGASRVVLCLDRKPYIRSQQYPKYKKISRTPPDEDIVAAYAQSQKLVLELADVLGLPVWGVDGFESDDLVGFLVHKYRHRFDRIVAQSNDADLGQLFWCDAFRLHKKDPGPKGKSYVVDRELFFSKLEGISPEQYVLMLALMGTHNDVEGIDRVGIKTAMAAVKDPSRLRVLRDQHAELIERNLALISLPHKQFPTTERIPKQGSVDLRALYRFAGRYDITITKMMEDALSMLNKE